MNEATRDGVLMNEATREYVRQHRDEDVRMLALRGSKMPDVDLTLALDQIGGWQTARHKLPSWAAVDGIIFPPHISMEQCSSEQTATYKATIARRLLSSVEATAKATVPSSFAAGPQATVPSSSPLGSVLIDLTGGYGVDFSVMARAFDRAVYVERQPHLCAIARHNMPLLHIDHATIVEGDSAQYLASLTERAGLIFIDPARRDTSGGRTYAISDCTPDVIALRDMLLSKAKFVMIKLSPMLDWQAAVQQLGREWVREVHIVSTGGECKELLLVLSALSIEAPSGAVWGAPLRLFCINDNNTFVVDTAEAVAPAPVSLPLSYLYEPNASIMNGGCFDALANSYGVSQLSANSHLFTSESPIDDFPGRRFRIEATTTLNKKDLRRALEGISQANITVRNFPMSVAELHKRLKMKEGGSVYIFATTLYNGEHVLVITTKLAR